jgi:hypothetical protein
MYADSVVVLWASATKPLVVKGHEGPAVVMYVYSVDVNVRTMLIASLVVTP